MPVKIEESAGESAPAEFLQESQKEAGLPESAPPTIVSSSTIPEAMESHHPESAPPTAVSSPTVPESMESQEPESAPPTAVTHEPAAAIPESAESEQPKAGPSGVNLKAVGAVALVIILLVAGYFLVTQFMTTNTGREVVELVPLRSDEGYLYMDLKGQIAINPQFKNASIFRDGLALVQAPDDEGLWGYIDARGNYKINPGYQEATVFSDGMAWVVSKGGPPTAIGTNGETLIVLREAEQVAIFHEGLAAFSVLDPSGLKWGFVDKSGNKVIVPQFDAVGDFSEGICPFRDTEGNWGYIDKSGKILINAQFQDAMSFSGGRAVVKSGALFGLIDPTGKFVVNPQFNEMQADGDWYLVRMDGKYGWVDENGQLVINPQFDRAGPFAGAELAPVRIDKDWGYSDKKGNLVINPQFDEVLSFNGEMAMAGSGRSIGFINSEGRYIINPQKYKANEDYIRYVIFGDTEYGQVETDFLNIAPLVQRLQEEINVNTINGMNFSSTYSQIIQKFNLPSGHFTKTYDEQQVSSVSINTSVGISFLVHGYPFKQLAQSNGFYMEYTEVFDPTTTPNSFAYQISLSGKYLMKKDQVLEAIQNAFPAFRKEVSTYDKTTVNLIGENFTLTISPYASGIRIYSYSPYLEIGD